MASPESHGNQLLPQNSSAESAVSINTENAMLMTTVSGDAEYMPTKQGMLYYFATPVSECVSTKYDMMHNLAL